MANLGYSQLLAEMIARARPQQAPPQTRPAFVGGGGGEGIMGTQTHAEGKVHISGEGLQKTINKLFGRFSDEELDKYLSAVSERLRVSGDEEVETIMNQPSTQYIIDYAESRRRPVGLFGFVRSTGRTALGRPIYTYVRTLGEKAAPEKRVEVGLYGQAPAAELERERLRAQLTPLSETQILALGPEVAAPYIESRAALKRKEAEAAETQSERALRSAQADAYMAQRDLLRMQEKTEAEKLKVQYSPEQIELEREKLRADIEYHRKLALKAEAEARQASAQVVGASSKEQMELWEQSKQLYKQGQNTFMQVMTRVKPGDEDVAIRNLTSMTSSHIQSALAIFGRSGPASNALSFWLGEVSDLIEKEVPRVGGVPFTGWLSRPDPKVESKLQKYAKDAKNLMEMAGLDTTMSITIPRGALNLITEVCEKTTLTSTTTSLAQWAINFFSPLQGDPDIARNIDRLRRLISPKTTPRGIIETPVPSPEGIPFKP